jgi:hypothetical protein
MRFFHVFNEPANFLFLILYAENSEILLAAIDLPTAATIFGTKVLSTY